MTQPAAYRAHRRFIAVAARSRAVWRVAFVALAFEIAFVATPALTAEMAYWFGPADSPAGTVFDLAIFIIPALAIVIAVKALHARGLRSLTGPWPRFRRDLVTVTLAVSLVLIGREMLLAEIIEPAQQQMETPIWLLWLIPGMIALFIQVGTEELFYRGYLQQQFAVLSQRRIIWLIGPSVLFGIAHVTNSEDSVDGALWAIWAGFIGLACADLTARTGSLGAAIGLHLANNLFAMVVIAEAGTPGSGLALFAFSPSGGGDFISGEALPDNYYFVADVITSAFGVFVIWTAALLGLRWRG